MHDASKQVVLTAICVPFKLDHLLETLCLEDLELLCFSSEIHEGDIWVLKRYNPIFHNHVHVYLSQKVDGVLDLKNLLLVQSMPFLNFVTRVVISMSYLIHSRDIGEDSVIAMPQIEVGPIESPYAVIWIEVVGRPVVKIEYHVENFGG